MIALTTVTTIINKLTKTMFSLPHSIFALSCGVAFYFILHAQDSKDRGS